VLQIAHHLEQPPVRPPADGASPEPPRSARIQQDVEWVLGTIEAAVTAGEVPDGLRGALTHLTTVLRRLAPGLYRCYDVPELPRTNNALEQFYRHLKTSQRRITGRKRADTFVVRVGGFAVYAIQATGRSVQELLDCLSGIPAAAWQAQRAVLRATQQRQTQMRRFRLHRDAYLADLEARWALLAQPP
jgi:hypothetical protein